MSRIDDLERLAKYAHEHEMFGGAAPNACGGCNHRDCKSNTAAWEEMRAMVTRLAATRGFESDTRRTLIESEANGVRVNDWLLDENFNVTGRVMLVDIAEAETLIGYIHDGKAYSFSVRNEDVVPVAREIEQ
jgi:hypothetical protein